MKIQRGTLWVDVLDPGCFDRPCYQLGFDKGTFVQGRGYTSYHKDRKGNYVEHPVCQTRHLSGCPTNSGCPLCRSASVLQPGEPCNGTWDRNCKGILVTPAQRS